MSETSTRAGHSWRGLYAAPQITAHPGQAPSAPAPAPPTTGGLASGLEGAARMGEAYRRRQEDERRRRASNSPATYRFPGESPGAPEPRLGRELGNAPLPQRPQQETLPPVRGIAAAAPRDPGKTMTAMPEDPLPLPPPPPPSRSGWLSPEGRPAVPGVNPWGYAGGGDIGRVAEPPDIGAPERPEPSIQTSTPDGQAIAVPKNDTGRVMADEAKQLYQAKEPQAHPGAAPAPLPAIADAAVKAMKDIGKGIGGMAGGAAMASGGEVADDTTSVPALHTHGYGLVAGASPGRADHVPARVRPGSYVLPADVVSGAGQGNTSAGARAIMSRLRHASTGRPVGYAGGGRTGVVDVALSGGEVVIPPEDVQEIGEGDHKRGSAKLDQFIRAVRQHIASISQRMPPPR